MINPLNELSEVYKKKIDIKLPQGNSPMGGDGAKPGKNRKAYVEPMSIEEVEPVKEGQEDADVDNDGNKDKSDKYLLKRRKAIAKAIKEAKHATAKQMHSPHEVPSGDIKKLVKKAVKRIDTDVDGDTDKNDKAKGELGEFIPGVGNKRLYSTTKTTTAKEGYSNWRDDAQDLLEIIGGAYGGVAGVDNERNLENPKAKKASKSSEKITEKSVKNKIIINPPQGMKEAFAELGGVITEMYEITEKIDIAKADMGDVIKDFRKSDAPQFKGKSDKKKQQMAIAAKLATEETEEEKKKREMLAKTKEHDDKQSGKLAEADMTGAPSIKNIKPAKKTNVKYDTHMKVMAPTIKAEGRALAGVLSTIRAKNGMGTITAKGADKLQDKKEKTMGEEMSIKDQMRISREAAKNRNPNPDHKAIRGKMLKKSLPKDTRTDAQKMTDATGPRPGSNYRGD